ncbi:MAG: DUF6435 family protein [Acidobacteriota bacterium]
MFGFLKKDPRKKLEARYAQLMTEARDLQRRGDIQGFAVKSDEAEEVGKQLDALTA